MADFVPNSGVQHHGIRSIAQPAVGEYSFVDTADDAYLALLDWSDTVLKSAGVWKPTIGDIFLGCRILFTYGGKKFIEFSRPVNNVFFHWAPTSDGQTRDALAFTTRKAKGTSSQEYIDTYGFTFIIQTEPAKDIAWGFGHGFSPAITGLQLEGPVTIEDIIYD
jgi:hypothetical protein